MGVRVATAVSVAASKGSLGPRVQDQEPTTASETGGLSCQAFQIPFTVSQRETNSSASELVPTELTGLNPAPRLLGDVPEHRDWRDISREFLYRQARSSKLKPQAET